MSNFWKPIILEEIKLDVIYLVRDKENKYNDLDYALELCVLENDHHDVFFWTDGENEYPFGFFKEYMEIPKE